MKAIPFSLLLATASFGWVSAQEAPQKIDLSDPNLLVVDSSVIPIPVEIFSSLDKLGPQDWSKQIGNRTVTLDANRSRTAMLFGLIISDGFIAVQAQDKEAVRRIGREVLNLAQPLNVEGSVQAHANAIIDAAGRGEWSVVRKELDKTRQTVLNTMTQNRDEQLVALVSLGGWLGGTEALSAVLKQNYSTEGSDLLNQPDLVRQLQNDFNTIPARAKRGKVFDQISKTLAHLESLMRADATGAISKGKVIEISLSTKNLVEAIYEI